MSDETKHEETMAGIESRRIAYDKNPWAFTVWYVLCKAIGAIIWISIFFLMAQCSCDGCMIK